MTSGGKKGKKKKGGKKSVKKSKVTKYEVPAARRSSLAKPTSIHTTLSLARPKSKSEVETSSSKSPAKRGRSKINNVQKMLNKQSLNSAPKIKQSASPGGQPSVFQRL